ncbi:hypothetical protein OIDMADRAFT_21417 [Oidiodendron maius Zn]|uniref:Uncharacterized protein n=1 Tax=Oidiodendron maius (strain Zn) TaxID=913774 RepID=A0A0C3C6B5_OIDMZ|nr:hypothetical protein OIDMADRAFT_21417 [Oidiodendron maius Zn]
MPKDESGKDISQETMTTKYPTKSFSQVAGHYQLCRSLPTDLSLAAWGMVRQLDK